VVQVEQALEDEDTILIHGQRSASRRGDGRSPAALEGISFFRTEVAAVPAGWPLSHPPTKSLTVIERSASLAEAAVASPGGAFPGAAGSSSTSRIRTCRRSLWSFRTGSHYAGMGQALYDSFPSSGMMDRAAAAADFDLLTSCSTIGRRTFRRPGAATCPVHRGTRHGRHSSLLAFTRGDGRPQFGELTPCAGWCLFPGGRVSNCESEALCMDKAAAMNVDPGVMAATDAPGSIDRVDPGTGRCPHQQYQFTETGRTERQHRAVKAFGNSIKEKGYRFTLLRSAWPFTLRS